MDQLLFGDPAERRRHRAADFVRAQQDVPRVQLDAHDAGDAHAEQDSKDQVRSGALIFDENVDHVPTETEPRLERRELPDSEDVVQGIPTNEMSPIAIETYMYAPPLRVSCSHLQQFTLSASSHTWLRLYSLPPNS